ncbi:YitT family protein [Porphyromonas levii]|uniref:YitT family protein n=1 Tax=Porphyromonas levii TaxID=28114 RepID=A0A4Y8WPW2_9PORP|nr:YitT family protein [Porphyromonas levii]MBR8703751.1 hypothetical protein [Porphyromonas levii]MBR8730680.1 hypothetical protein [Porphyromonas levii]MBR8758641.1 hypothetical protein [Porphyromonas levii]MBR8762868.1 hypothetical protein [Porphyromonas levii]MBR8802194.1 hypothetical protein [Porphyromonas levii]
MKMKEHHTIGYYFTSEFWWEAMVSLWAMLKTKKFWVELVIMTVAMFIGAAAVYFFLIPSKLIVGSITGLSIVVGKLFPIMSVGSWIFVINLILIILSFLLIGCEFGAKTVYTALILGPFINFFESIVEMPRSMFAVEVAGEWISNPWFDLLLFILVMSAAQSILFSINASTGGLDIIAKIINKYTGVHLGVSVTIAGGLICATAFFINPPALVFIGLVGTWMNGLILDKFMLGMSSRNRVYITTNEHEKIRSFVVNELDRGLTMREVIGGYSNETKMQIEIILTKDDLRKLVEFIDEEDISAFVTTDTVSEVRGLWNRNKKKKKKS